MLEVIDFSKKYRNNKNYSASHISFSVAEGEVVGLVGSNGAGKSTIIKSVIGVLPFEEGKILVGGYDIARQPEKAKRQIGYVPDDHSVYDKLTGREYINYIGSLYGATKAQKKYVVDVLAKQFEIRHALDLQIAGYSHGMKQKICILGALAHHPKLWILDEPMVGLDHQTMMSLCSFIRSYADAKHSVLFSTHNLDVVGKVCDRVVFIRHGQVANIVDLTKNRNFDLDAYYMELNREDEQQSLKNLRNAPAPAPVSAPAPVVMQPTVTVYTIPSVPFATPAYPGTANAPASPQKGGNQSSEVKRNA